MAEFLKGVELVLNDESKVDAGEHLKGKIVGLYFSAGWCPPCRQFSPKLKRFYDKVKAAGKNFEVIFVSRDREAEDLVEYYEDHHGAWTYLEFGNPKIQELLEKYEIKTIPALRIVKPDGSVIVEDARTQVADKGTDGALELFESWEAFFEM
uniref:Thioredoxin domain-containing protein n=1 Tax=Steinernema glaseri TaxID=37863 RepID=A0A1I7Y2N3_9BILA